MQGIPAAGGIWLVQMRGMPDTGDQHRNQHPRQEALRQPSQVSERSQRMKAGVLHGGGKDGTGRTGRD